MSAIPNNTTLDLGVFVSAYAEASGADLGPASRKVVSACKRLYDKHPDQLTGREANAFLNHLSRGDLAAAEEDFDMMTTAKPNGAVGRLDPSVLPPRGDGDGPALQRIAVRYLLPSDFNPRQTFDADKLAALGESLATDGQSVPLLVRPHPTKREHGMFQVIDGERRYRAAKAAGLESLQCIVREMDDATAEFLAGLANIEREQFDAIEEARWMKRMLDAGHTQTALAKRLSKTQGHVSNTVRLLELPEVWQAKVISGEIPHTWARELLPWTKRPAVLETMAGDMKQGHTETIGLFRAALKAAVRDCSRPFSGWFRFQDKRGQYREGTVAFKVTKAQEAKLDIEVVDAGDYQGKHKRAFNLQLWHELQAEGEKRQEAKRGASAADVRSRTSPEARQKTDAQKRKEQAEVLAKRIQHYRTRWLQARCAVEVRELDKVMRPHTVYRLFIHFAVQNDRQRNFDELADAVKAAGGNPAPAQLQWGRRKDPWRSLASVPDKSMGDVVAAALAAWLAKPVTDSAAHLTARDVEDIAAELGVDLATEWRCDREFLELHTKGQLVALAKEWKLKGQAFAGTGKRDELIDLILAAEPAGCPKSLLPAKRKTKRRR